MSSVLSANPNDRMGVFKTLESVPDRYRLSNHAAAFDGRDVWQEYVTESVYEEWPDATDFFYESVDRAGRRWKEHMAGRSRHHALATPQDVIVWCEQLHADLSLNTIYNQYWLRIEGFYSWLQTHADYPHVYHPVLMAVPQSEIVRKVWNLKLSGGERKGGVWE